MRVFLDANVILTGALNPDGPAGKFCETRGCTEFLHSSFVLTECDNVIENAAQDDRLSSSASLRIRRYLDRLDSELCPECPPPSGITTYDPDDEPILGAAIAAGADSICTYNLRDFPTDPVPPRTPLSIQRRISSPAIENYVQRIILSSNGTLLYFGQIHHPSSMGPIISSSNGTTVTCNDAGEIILGGPNVTRFRASGALRGNAEFRLTLRYNDSSFEAALWEKENSVWAKTVISTGAAPFSQDTRPVLCFVPNHSFSGTIQCISGLPRFVKDQQLTSALENFSLEAIAGSLDLRALFQRETSLL